jgi:dienelactone hydrolase
MQLVVARPRYWRRSVHSLVVFLALSVFAVRRAIGQDVAAPPGTELPGTGRLELEGDIASLLVDGVDRFLLAEIARSPVRRDALWKDVGGTTREDYASAIVARRESLSRRIGNRDPRHPSAGIEFITGVDRPPRIAVSDRLDVYEIRWTAFGGVTGEGILLEPKGSEPLAIVVAIPDADISPEAFAGLTPGLPPESQLARRIAETGVRVVVPWIIDRRIEARRNAEGRGGAQLTTREFLYRPAFELGRHILGYEVAKVLAAVDAMRGTRTGQEKPIGVAGFGEGGHIALLAAAVDSRIDATFVSGYFDQRERVWDEPIDRNFFGRLEEFGDAELVRLVWPRELVVETCLGPELDLPGNGGAPSRLRSPSADGARSEFDRAITTLPRFQDARLPSHHVAGADGRGSSGGSDALVAFLKSLFRRAGIGNFDPIVDTSSAFTVEERGLPDATARRDRQIAEIVRHNAELLAESPWVRQRFLWDKIDTSSAAAFDASIAPFREVFRDQVIGRFDRELLPPKPRTRKSFSGDGWTGYEVVLDVFEDVIAYGILLVPNEIPAGERRPVVVCQHGLEGRPQSVIGEKDFGSYKAFAAELAKRGFITFAPQNLYIFQDRFRTLQRKSYAIGKTLFSTIVPQHQQIVDWLETLPWVDPKRIAFYGLSYGGKSAMRIPPLVPEYCLSICSADFNEWVWKNASTRSAYSYVWTGEYEIFEFDLGSTFNYAEMAALIAPRPFMVERGHFDGVAPDETVAYEFAKVRHLYAARLGLGDRCEIEWFVGPHTIHGQKTYDFLHRWLDWPKRP